MRRPRELPVELQTHAFTREDLSGWQLDQERARRRDILRLAHGVFVSASAQWDSLMTARELAQALPDCWISHFTAARFYAWQPPRRLGEEDTIHLSQSRESNRRIRRPEVISHRQSAYAQDLLTEGGARITSPARTWLDLASALTEVELICFGDHLVRIPYPAFEGRTEPFATLGELSETLTRVSGVQGRRRACEALEQVRVGADSGAETRLRLALVDAGLPEPSLQVPLDPRSPRTRCADLGYPELKIAIQYEGLTHFTPEQAKADQRRDNAFLAQGWIVLRFNDRDYVQGFASAVRQVRGALGHRNS